ncbi:hypothetical protein GYMLUDRAFT_87492 [Collybiopsis luxurians FD-317 M1]|uniref:Uncharacterized protein n=1 Tax=Collybiopsis luxurians FD-317 M1 TaxID=944289 RepID=A0A0D0C0F3_9AGAR|nr:hypothetical protein GYMLUDRAFT_87492 [Collybiopsis luxurians FD-317 M1]
MASNQTSGIVKHLLLRNQSPFDATLQLFDRSLPKSGYPLGPDLRAGDSIVFQLAYVNGLTNGTVFGVEVGAGVKFVQNGTALTYTDAAPPVRKAKFVVKGTKLEPVIDFLGFTDVEIPTEILENTDFEKRYKLLKRKPIPHPPRELTEKFRWIQCVVKNQTQFQILLQDTYFNSGKYWQPPTAIDPFDQMIFSCCNGDETIGTGVTGGTAFQVILDAVTSYNFSVGWTNPSVGGFKASIVDSPHPIDGYDRATLEGNAFTSEQKFRGLQKNGNPTEWHLHFSAAAGQYMIYEVTQIQASN